MSGLHCKSTSATQLDTEKRYKLVARFRFWQYFPLELFYVFSTFLIKKERRQNKKVAAQFSMLDGKG